MTTAALQSTQNALRRYRPYPRYKDSGIEWLGKIPAGWPTKRLKYCVRLCNEKLDGQATELPYTGLEHIESWTGRRIIPSEGTEADGEVNTFRPGDVLFGKLRPYLAKVYRALEEGVCTGELLILRPVQVDQSFLFYYMLCREFVFVVDSSTYGAKMPRASWDFISSLPVPVPSADEQRAIAAFLDRETARIDALIEKKRRQIELLHEKRTALISHAVTKGLDPNVPMKDSGIEWLGQIPKHWAVKRLNYLTAFTTGWTPPTGRDDLYQGDHLWANISDLGPKVLRSTEKTISDTAIREGRMQLVRAGSLLFSFKLSVGMVSIAGVDMYTNEAIAAFAPSDRVETAYLYWAAPLLVTRNAQENIYGAPLLSRDRIAHAYVLSPPIPEQRAIAAFLDRETARIDALVQKIKTSIDLLREYRTALISAAVTGKIDVREEAA